MGHLGRQLHQLVIRIIALSVLITSAQPQLLFAQSSDIEDFEAPTITLDELKSGKLGEDQLFSIRVVDDIAVKSVSLFYRFDPSEDFQVLPMEATGDQYNLSIPTDDITATSVQYYFQAEDTTGNRALKGYNFDPLERSLASATRVATSGDKPVKKKSRTLYYVLGALAVVALGAAAAGGGSDDGGGGTVSGDGSNCGSSGCQINLVIGAP